ncbi:predicted protein [Sclerotinia sclerotiorum 1980 UF-70]|uniref:Uncharacterized protein n=1 Tax=Sclerotinia sclerotiorum (strain ATCC 18683 / 1980 / Ss-1) TaxID=665079 RepID=A7EWU9_SCLS1|nr:predicted protein [Sclerotinia sclerotiorum 1980 UF-70]EDN93941.1 predicted protein [Sclerotinia sclerotiorum 1980 UF-70]
MGEDFKLQYIINIRSGGWCYEPGFNEWMDGGVLSMGIRWDSKIFMGTAVMCAQCGLG